MENLYILLFVLGGLFTMAGGIFDWEWYMTHRRARIIVKVLGRTGARIFYIIFGIALIIFGIALAFNLVPGPK